MRGSRGPASRAARLAVIAAVFVLVTAACGTAAPPGTADGASPTTGGPTPSPTASSHAPAAVTPAPALAFAGVWATAPLTLGELRAAVQANGIDPKRFDDAVGSDPGFVDNVAIELEIVNGRWLEYEIDDGVPAGVGWKGNITPVDDDTFLVKDLDSPCEITYDVAKHGDEITVNIANEDCTDPNDIVIQTAIYESAPFHLVEAADAAVPVQAPSPAASGALPSASAPSTARDRLTTHQKGSVKGASLGYLEYLPADYGDEERSPLLVFLHGSGQSGNGTEADLGKLTVEAIPYLINVDRWPDDRPFVVLAPQHAEGPGAWCFTPAEIDAFLAFALQHYDVDAKRVYLTGLSCGAIGLWSYLGAHANEVVAAAVPIAGYGIGAFDGRGCALGALPIWAFHGAQDANVVLRGDVYPMESLQACTDPKAVDARLTVYVDGGHDVWSDTYDLTAGYDIYSWMLSHTK